jgi:hypothetical protein
MENKELQNLVTLLESRQDFRRFSGYYIDSTGNILSEEQINEQEWLDNVQSVLDWVGIIPVIGDAVDVINALIYFTRAGIDGEFMPNGLNGLITCIAIIPVVGSAISIPLKAAFKAIPVAAASKVIKELMQGSGEQAAKMFTKESAGASGAAAKELTSLQSLLLKNKDKILSGTKKMKSLFNALAVIPLTKVDDKLAAAGVKLIEKLEKFLLTLSEQSVEAAGKMAGDAATKTAKEASSRLVIKSIPVGRLTKNGRLAAKGFGWTKAGHKRMFYASQDMFANYLLKEGASKLPKELTSELAEQASKNLASRGVRNASQEELAREFSNILIVNESRYFDDFLKSASFNDRAQRFIRTITDPSIVKDAMGWAGTIRKMGVKGIKASATSFPSEEDYRDEREFERNQDDIMIKDKEKEGSYYGKKRNV